MKIFSQKISAKCVFSTFLLPFVFCFHVVSFSAQVAEVGSKSVGIDLREKLTETVKRNSDRSPNEVNRAIEVVLLHAIPVGTPFDDAEAILRAAGFRIFARGLSRPRQPGEYRGMMLASLAPVLVSGTIFKTYQNLYVSLYPKDPDRFDRVDKISAHIEMPMP